MIDMNKAFSLWYTYYEHREADQRVLPFRDENLKPSQGGWLKMARLALFVSTGTMAKKLKISRAGYCQFEANEARGAVTLQKLAAAAEALDCELIYALRPKSKKTFSQDIWERLLPESKDHGWVKSRPPIAKHRALAFIAHMKMGDPSIRQRMGWSVRFGKSRHPLVERKRN